MSIKLIKDLGNNRYEVEIQPVEKAKGVREIGFGPVHDYIYFTEVASLTNPDGSVGSTVKYIENIHIPIRDFNKFVLPKLLEHKYCKPEHLADREHTEDDQYWNKEWQKGEFKEPRYKKGDKYPGYAYDTVAIKFFDEDKKQYMIALRLSGETEYNIMTSKMYNLIKDKLIDL